MGSCGGRTECALHYEMEETRDGRIWLKSSVFGQVDKWWTCGLANMD